MNTTDANMEMEFEDDFLDHEQRPKKGIIKTLTSNISFFSLSLALHMLALLVIALLPQTKRPDKKDDTIIHTTTAEPDTDEPEPPPPITIDPIKTPVPVDPTTEEPIEDTPEIPDEDLPDEPEDNELDVMISDLEFTPNIQAPAMLGFDQGPSKSGPEGYGEDRFGEGKTDCINIHQGGETVPAVKAALKWLAEHQEPDGHWDALKYQGSQKGTKGAITALAILPFLGDGHTEQMGVYKRTVRSGIQYLNSIVSKGTKDQQMYNKMRREHFTNNYGMALCLMTLSETSIFGSSPVTRRNANIIAKHLIDEYLQSNKAWVYGGPGSDLSVSGWVALALKSAKVADLPALKTKEAGLVFKHYKRWIDKVATDAKLGLGYYRAPERKSHTKSMTIVGLFSKQILDFPKNDPFIQKAIPNILKTVKSGSMGKDSIQDSYSLYYGALASFHQQGALWRTWNPYMKKLLLTTQCRGNPKDKGGSWDPGKSHTDETVGRVGTTALMTLCLEVYYRNYLLN
ncbi:MAG: hypothetical protein HQL32_10085 [Planctomycetes bacterium]|nr:hypothetical protein [Planctomycetota bacterium]